MIDTKYLYAALLLVILVVQLDGQQTGRRKSTDLRHHKHHLSKSPVVGHRSIGGNGIRHAARHSFLNRTIKRGRKRQNSRRSSDPTTYLPVEEDPDSAIEGTSFKNIVRVRGGAVGYSRLAIPTWFRPIKYFSIRPDEEQFFGSIIVLTSDTVLMDRAVSVYNKLEVGMEMKLSFMHHPEDPMIETSFLLDGSTARPIRWIYFKLSAILESGFLLLKLADPIVRYPDKWLIRWSVNYNRHGYPRREFPEDKFKRPDLGCFGFMYTRRLTIERNFPRATVTEYPVSIISYKEDERTTVYANHGRFDYERYSRLEENYNSGSPVFCGLEGSLRYFARRVNDTTLQLIPLHDIANELELLDRDTYYKLTLIAIKRDRGDNEPGWMPNEQTPKWFRQMYRKEARRVQDNRVSWYAGYMIVLSKHYFLIPNYVAESIDFTQPNPREWTHFHSLEYPTKRENSFGDQPPVRQNQSDWPKFVTTISGTNFSLYYRPNEDPAWNENEWFKINIATEHTESNCNYLEHRLIGTSPEPDTRLDKRTPVFVIPKSCSHHFCYVTLDVNDKSTKFTDLNPVMCEGYPAFFLMGNIGNNDRGWLVMKIEYLLKSLRTSERRLYEEIVGTFSREYLLKLPDELYPSKSLQRDMKPPGWFKLMYDNSPSGGPMLGYAGALTFLEPDKLVASNYAYDNALMPRILDEDINKTRYVTYLTGNWTHIGDAPSKFSGYRVIPDEFEFPEIPPTPPTPPPPQISGNSSEPPPTVDYDKKKTDDRLAYLIEPEKLWEILSASLNQSRTIPTTNANIPASRDSISTRSRNYKISFLPKPNLDHYMDRIDMVVLERNQEFSTPELPSMYDYDPDENPRLPKNCYAYTYTFNDDRSGLLFTHVPVQITQCDYTYCYGPLNPFSQDYDLNDGVHAGAPVVCGKDLMFFNAPYPDHLYRARFRVIRLRVIQSKLPNQNILTHETPPPWYRILNCRTLNPIIADNYTTPWTLPIAVVFSDNFFIASSDELNDALLLSHPEWYHWLQFNTTEQPTPAIINQVYGKIGFAGDDAPNLILSIGLDLSVYERGAGFELRGGGKVKMSSSIAMGQESKEDCWVYMHLLVNEPNGRTYFRFTKVKVTIRHCEKGFCHTTPYDDLYHTAAPIVCGGTLSYIYSSFKQNRYLLPYKPMAIQISTIYEFMNPSEETLKRVENEEKKKYINTHIPNIDQLLWPPSKINHLKLLEDDPARH